MLLLQSTDRFGDSLLDSLQLVDVSAVPGLGQGGQGCMDSRDRIPNIASQVLQHADCVLNATKNVIRLHCLKGLLLTHVQLLFGKAAP